MGSPLGRKSGVWMCHGLVGKEPAVGEFFTTFVGCLWSPSSLWCLRETQGCIVLTVFHAWVFIAPRSPTQRLLLPVPLGPAHLFVDRVSDTVSQTCEWEDSWERSRITPFGGVSFHNSQTGTFCFVPSLKGSNWCTWGEVEAENWDLVEISSLSVFQTPKRQKRLFCRYHHGHGAPQLLIAPFKEEDEWDSPHIVRYYDVMSDEEIETIKAVAKPKVGISACPSLLLVLSPELVGRPTSLCQRPAHGCAEVLQPQCDSMKLCGVFGSGRRGIVGADVHSPELLGGPLRSKAGP